MAHLLSPEDFEKLPVLAFPSLLGNPEAGYTALQRLMLPYADAMEVFWWACFAAVALYWVWRIGSPVLLGTLPPPVQERPPCRWNTRYTRLCSIEEIAADPLLRWFGGAVLLGFLASFRNWQFSFTTTLEGIQVGKAICWPVFQGCHDLIWMQTLPAGYSQTVFFMVLFGLIILAAWALIVGHIRLAHTSILTLFLAKLYLTVQSFSYNANYDYYHTIFTLIFLFLPHKRFFGGMSVVLFYYLSTASKIHPSWTLGMYFSALKGGLPIFPDGTEPVLTNFVILMEMLMAWFLFSTRKWLQRFVFGFFCLFHLYSGTLVGYHYPTIVMPSLVIFFGPHVQSYPAIPRTRRSLAGWGMVLVLFGLQMVARVIPGDERLTLEGNFYGLYMFEANHQCHAQFTDVTGQVFYEGTNTSARNRCDPWQYLSEGQNKFCRPGEVPPKIRYRLIHSINGGPFFEIVNESDLCALKYHPFRHNDWIKDETTAPMVGRPLKNYYW